MDELDRRLINALRGGLPLCERPFAQSAAALGLSEDELLARLQALRAANVITRFGPQYDAERLGGAFSLCAMRVPAADLERVAALVNAHPEVAHNYERAHRLNMWFVLATETPAQIAAAIARIEAASGYAVLDLPREEEFFVGLELAA